MADALRVGCPSVFCVSSVVRGSFARGADADRPPDRPMVKQGPYELQVLVGGQPLEEHPFPATGDVYVESKFNTPVSYKGKPETEKDPFGETYEQSWCVRAELPC